MSILLSERRQPTSFADRVPAMRPAPLPSAPAGSAAAMPRRQVTPRVYRGVSLGALVATLREWHRRRAQRRELAGLDARTLRDIGLDPGAVDYELGKWFWQSSRDWRD